MAMTELRDLNVECLKEFVTLMDDFFGEEEGRCFEDSDLCQHLQSACDKSLSAVIIFDSLFNFNISFIFNLV